MNAVILQNLVKRFGKKNVLDNISLELPENCIVGLIGRNGAGKTTLLKTLAGYLRPTEGRVTVLGQEPFDNIRVLSDIVFMDDERYNDSAVLWDLVNQAALSYSRFDKVTALKLLDYFNIPVKAKIKKLSKGMKTLFSLVIALLSRSPLTMLDEPTIGLDAAHRKEFFSLLLRDYTNHPRTIIVSSHLISELEGLMEQVVLIDQGKLIFNRAIEDVQSYALYLSGHRRVLEELEGRHSIIYKESMGEMLVLGVVNNLSEEELQGLESSGVKISAMSVQDVCVNLTATNKGGVLDVIAK
ncbi:MAG: ABC transporter ATP-binding protein [Clostridiaceae bacterium]|jgi:ABC-2 type transport system ATP-binding protein|nr:ABC transporter ATP-binding protein [Bacillota bacterium]NLI38570.1 ABC transporter ATP-binding protein [Clostridiaceae bacterium]